MERRETPRGRVSRSLSIVALALSFGTADCRDEGSEHVRIGVLLPYSTVSADFSHAMEMAIDEINAAGGAHGRSIELVRYDTMFDEGLTDSVFRLAVDDGAVAMLGGLRSRFALVEAAAALDLRVPIVGMSATSDELTTIQPPGESRFFYRVAPPDRLQAVVVADRAYNRGDLACRKLGIVHTDDSYGNGLASLLETQFEARSGAVVATVAHPFLMQDWSGAVATIAAGAPDCVALVSNVDDGRAFRKTWVDSAMPTVHWIATDAMVGTAVTPQYADAHLSDGILAIAPWSIDRPETAEFVSRFQARFGSPPSPWATYAYDAAAVIGFALAAAPTFDGDDVRDALVSVANGGGTPIDAGDLGHGVAAIAAGEDVDYVGMSGHLDFDACGDVIGDYVVLRLDANAPLGFEVVETGINPGVVASTCPQ